MADRRAIPETDRRADWPRLVAQAINYLQTRFTAIEEAIAMVGVDRDTEGNPVPTWKGHAFTYDGSGNLETDTVTDGTGIWIRTYTYSGGNQTADSGFVKQP